LKEKEIKDIFRRDFTRELEDHPDKTVYDLFDWKYVDVDLKNFKTGETIFDLKHLEFPESYSQNACNIIASKYFRRRGIPNGLGYEHSMREVADRMVGFWADALVEEGIIENDEQRQIFYDEIVFALLSQMWAPNSPQWFNTGIKRKYGIAGSKDELYYYDEETGKVVESQDRYTRTQASACFILSITDQLLGKHSISDHYVSETKLFKGGSGVGTNFSPLRAEGEHLLSGGQSSGLMSFLQGLDRNAGAIKSGGTTRRAAKMVIVDVDHPEIETFIKWKAHEEEKVRALGKMGYDTSLDGEAYQTVAGQNANNSVRVNQSFMDAVRKLPKDPGQKMKLKGRVDETADRIVNVSDIWDEINEAEWECADPGLQFDDIFNAWHTCPAGADGDINNPANRINATNPCSEYAFLDNTACNLASINLYRFFDPETRKIDIERYSHLAGLIQLVLESSIYWGQFPTEDVAERSWQFRTTGLGVANVASVIMALGYPYDSDEARNLISALTGIMTGHSYYVSALMAQKAGAFPKYEINKPYMQRVIRNHARVAGELTDPFENLGYKPFTIDHELLKKMGFENISLRVRDAWKDAIESGSRFGYRNAQVSVIAPTGTISFAMDCGATSAEPFYSNVVFKKLVGGGSMEIINPVVETALKTLGYTLEESAEIIDFMMEKDENGMLRHSSLHGAPHLKPEHYAVFDTANEISPEGHVRMVAALTPMISGSVSKTVNLPASATVDDVKRVNLLAYVTGCKAIAIYRDGCKMIQPLSSGQDLKKKGTRLEDLSYDELLKYAKEHQSSVPIRHRPEGMRMSRTHSAKIDGIELYITIGFYEDGKMAEIFVSTDKDGTVVKGLLASLSKSISHMLQYNIPPENISTMLRGQKYEPSGFVTRHPYIKFASSISDLISKVIDIECGDYTMCQIKPGEDVQNQPMQMVLNIGGDNTPAEPAPQETAAEEARRDGERLYGEVCSTCGGDNMIRNGTCKVCMDCGTTTGCS
jgi:ribonucleoside-diphosphate reductase alpha chain